MKVVVVCKSRQHYRGVNTVHTSCARVRRALKYLMLVGTAGESELRTPVIVECGIQLIEDVIVALAGLLATETRLLQ